MTSILYFSFKYQNFLVTLRGYANPETSVLKQMSAVSNMQSQSDLGPEIQHFYEVSNFGPFDVGHVIVSDLQILRNLKIFGHFIFSG